MHNPDTGEVTNATPFSQQLAFLNRGTLDFELTEAMAELVKAVRQTGKAGELVLKIKVGKLNARDEDALKLTPAVTIKVPQMPAYESVMFSTADGSLLRDDPKQRKLDLEVVGQEKRGPLIDSLRPAQGAQQ